MSFGPKLTARQYLIVLHDVLACAAALLLTFAIRFDQPILAAKAGTLVFFLPLFLLYAGTVNVVLGLHRNKWRFTSVPDLINIVRSSTILAASLLVLDYFLVAPNVLGQFFFGKITILLYWLLQIFFLAGARMAYRYHKYSRSIHHSREADALPTLILAGSLRMQRSYCERLKTEQ